jgi:DNA-binding protein Alba
MMATVVQEKTPLVQNKIPPSVLLIGKKRTLDYIAPALFRVNNTGELIIKATGSLSIVTAVDVAEMVKRDVENLAIQSITLGTDELTIATGERKRMSCIEIHLIKVSPIAVATPAIEVHVPVEAATPATVEIPIEEPTPAEVPVIVAEEKTKKPRAKRKSTATTKKKAASRKKKAVA